MNIKRPSRKTLMQFMMVILAVFVVLATVGRQFQRLNHRLPQ
jgi:hypothetical protein